MIRVLIVPADLTRGPEVREIDGDLPVLQDLVGGYIEVISPSTGVAAPWHGYANEEGLLMSLAYNPRATVLAKALGWYGEILVGDVVFLGDGRDGEEADVPPHVLMTAAMLMDIEEVSS